MKATLISEKKSPLLERSRYKFDLEYFGESTPNNTNVKKEIAKILKVDEKLVAIRHIYQKFGINRAKVIVHVYQKASDLDRLELDKKKKKAKKEEEAPKKETNEANEG